MMGLRCLGVCLCAGALTASLPVVGSPASNERIRVNEFYNGLTYWDVLIKALAG